MAIPLLYKTNMAAPFRQVFRNVCSYSHRFSCSVKTKITPNDMIFITKRPNSFGSFSHGNLSKEYSQISRRTGGLLGCVNSVVKTAVVITATVGTVSTCALIKWNFLKVFAEDKERPYYKPSREVRVETDHSGLKLTLYQYQSCPFCCKVRAFLDYYGLSYDVIEVNAVTKKQLKWSEYPKVPVLVVETEDSKKEVTLRDSSVIISVLESYLQDRSTSLQKYSSYFPCSKEKKGWKTKYEFSNRYFIMYQERTDTHNTPQQRSEERKWRKWADEHLVHMLSPNAYRTMKEAVQSFNYFSEVGQWEHNFSFWERQVVIYVGAFVMYIMGIILKNKYKLKDDVRQSLYDSCNEWVKALGKHKPFMGGNEPNLADLAVFGVLNSIEGCAAFQDTLNNTKIGTWYNRMKQVTAKHQGSHPLHAKTVPADKSESRK